MPSLNNIAEYKLFPVKVTVKKDTRASLIDKSRMITHLQVQDAIIEVSRAINTWHYQEE